MTYMSKHTLLCTTVSLVFLSSAARPPLASSKALNPSSPADAVLKEADHKKAGKLMGECIAAFLEREGRREAEDALKGTLEKKWRKAAKDRDPLALPDDLAAALWYSVDYTKVKGIKKGKIVDLPVDVDFYAKEGTRKQGKRKQRKRQAGDRYVATSAIWTPKKYSPKRKYPLVLCIPEPGEKPQDHLNDNWSDSALRDSAILVAIDMPEKTEHWGDMGERGNPEQAGGAGILLTTYAKIRDEYAIDFDRIFLAGRGLGVESAMKIASLFPDRFCAIIGRTGDAAEIAPENLSNLPCYFAGGGKLAQEFSEKLEDAERAERVLKPDAQLEDIWPWMQTITRRSIPAQVLLLPGSPIPNKAYWVEVPGKQYPSDARLSAKADRASNTITIEASGIETVTIFFNDTLVDLDQPVKVICNGAVHEDKIPRNFNSMMEQIYRGRSDPGRIYTAIKKYDIPAAAEDGE